MPGPRRMAPVLEPMLDSLEGQGSDDGHAAARTLRALGELAAVEVPGHVCLPPRSGTRCSRRSNGSPTPISASHAGGAGSRRQRAALPISSCGIRFRLQPPTCGPSQTARTSRQGLRSQRRLRRSGRSDEAREPRSAFGSARGACYDPAGHERHSALRLERQPARGVDMVDALQERSPRRLPDVQPPSRTRAATGAVRGVVPV